ncbi:hypothetical protein L1987_12150 [Smallanthus sonchifolius]|uniref:Uncharacterized protein n=1 Tax=Smallanthus sonchifolius TaxID=185202 RepID=A0ACB9JFL1_9ASTR|nr:hypothetical protein L1987_12150 [Smallanthus sonchifolius]
MKLHHPHPTPPHPIPSDSTSVINGFTILSFSHFSGTFCVLRQTFLTTFLSSCLLRSSQTTNIRNFCDQLLSIHTYNLLITYTTQLFENTIQYGVVTEFRRETNDRRKRRSGTFLELIMVSEEQSRRKSLSLGIL